MVKKQNKPMIAVGKKFKKPPKRPYLPDSWLHQRLKLSHRKHSGKVLPRHHSSYGILLLIFILIGWYITILSKDVLASPGSESGSITVSGIVNGPAPAVGASIVRPFNGETYTTSSVTVRGLCIDDLIVEIFRDNIFAGSTVCLDGKYEIQATLQLGSNDLIAKVRDDADLYGPDSPITKVIYKTPDTVDSAGNVVSGSSRVDTAKPSFLLWTDSVYRGTRIKERFDINFTINGGTGPYAVVIDWGDGLSDIISQTTEGTVKYSHVYELSGIYNVIISASDSVGAKARIQTINVVTTINAGTVKQRVNGSQDFATTYLPQNFYAIWRLYIFGVSMGSVFWLGERIMYYRLTKHVDK